MLAAALDESIQQLIKISQYSPNERLPKEEGLRCFLYHYYTSRGVLVHPEAGFFPADDGNKEACDLRLIFPDHEEWVEVKTARCAPGLNKKITEDSGRWDRDGWKLENAPAGAHRTFALYTFTHDHPDDSRDAFFGKIINLWPGYEVRKTKSHNFTWRDTNVKYATAWFWRW